MAIVFDSDAGTITGISTGGLPDGVVDAGTLASNAVTAAKLATDSVTAAKIAANSVDSAELVDGAVDDSHMASISGRKNMVINGAMQVAQRGTSNTNVTTSSYINMDRYETDISSAGTWTISQDSDAPSGFGSSFKFLCTTADASISGTDRIAFRHKIEGQNLQQLKKGTSDAESVTVSFWVKSNKTGTYIVEIYDYDNNRFISKSYTISVADTWEQKSITFAGDTTGALDNDNDKSLHLHFWLGVGSGFSSGTLQTSWGGAGNTNRAVGQVNLADSTSNYLNITGIQLELGSTATDFEHRSFGEELALCQRYYERWDKSSVNDRHMLGGGWGGVLVGQMFVKKRDNATVSFLNAELRDDGNTLRTITSTIAGDRHFNLYASGQSFKTGNLRLFSDGHIAFDAEL